MSRPAATRKRRADAEPSIAAIVDAAVELLSRRPEANMSEIAAAAGVGRVTLAEQGHPLWPSAGATFGGANGVPG